MSGHKILIPSSTSLTDEISFYIRWHGHPIPGSDTGEDGQQTPAHQHLIKYFTKYSQHSVQYYAFWLDTVSFQYSV